MMTYEEYCSLHKGFIEGELQEIPQEEVDYAKEWEFYRKKFLGNQKEDASEAV